MLLVELPAVVEMRYWSTQQEDTVFVEFRLNNTVINWRMNVWFVPAVGN